MTDPVGALSEEIEVWEAWDDETLVYRTTHNTRHGDFVPSLPESYPRKVEWRRIDRAEES